MKKVTIGNNTLTPEAPCIISLEAGSTFSDLEGAKKLVKAASSGGADAIKFQTFISGDAERIMGKKDLIVDYTTPTGKKSELILDAAKRRELSKDEWKELANYSHDLGLMFITSPYFQETVDFIVDLKVDAIKISKGDINNVLLINQAAKTGLPIILDGREKIEDVEKAVKICESNDNDQIVIMHCPSGYPTENSGVHLRAIGALQKKFDYPIGFADHSPGALMNYAALSLGVKMLEVTITSNKSIEHSEHFMSLEPQEIKPFIENIRAIEQAKGDPNILFSSRVPESNRRHLVAKKDISKGEEITYNLLDFQRPGNMGISVAEGFNILGKKSLNNISKGTVLEWNMLK